MNDQRAVMPQSHSTNVSTLILNLGEKMFPLSLAGFFFLYNFPTFFFAPGCTD